MWNSEIVSLKSPTTMMLFLFSLWFSTHYRFYIPRHNHTLALVHPMYEYNKIIAKRIIRCLHVLLQQHDFCFPKSINAIWCVVLVVNVMIICTWLTTSFQVLFALVTLNSNSRDVNSRDVTSTALSRQPVLSTQRWNITNYSFIYN